MNYYYGIVIAQTLTENDFVPALGGGANTDPLACGRHP
jgi:hypothetical protein